MQDRQKPQAGFLPLFFRLYFFRSNRFRLRLILVWIAFLPNSVNPHLSQPVRWHLIWSSVVQPTQSFSSKTLSKTAQLVGIGDSFDGWCGIGEMRYSCSSQAFCAVWRLKCNAIQINGRKIAGVSCGPFWISLKVIERNLVFRGEWKCSARG